MKIYGDLLTRRQMVDDISSIIRSCTEMKKPMTFSIEGEWGKGKTWIIEKVADSLKKIVNVEGPVHIKEVNNKH